MKSGIYLIQCSANLKNYVGVSKHIPTRWSRHRGELRRGTHGNKHLQSAYNMYGEGAFSYSVIREDAVDLAWWESFYIRLLSADDSRFGFNSRVESAYGTFTLTAEARQRMMGRPCKQETRDKLSASLRGRFTGIARTVLTEDAKAKISRSLTGQSQSKETRDKRAESLRGSKRTEEARRNISEGTKKAWAKRSNNNNSNRGV